MDFFYATDLAVPVSQIILLLFLSTISLLFGKVRVALLLNYFFTLYWAYFLNKERFVELGLASTDLFSWMYFGFGFLVAGLAMIGFLTRQH